VLRLVKYLNDSTLIRIASTQWILSDSSTKDADTQIRMKLQKSLFRFKCAVERNSNVVLTRSATCISNNLDCLALLEYISLRNLDLLSRLDFVLTMWERNNSDFAMLGQIDTR